MSHAEDLRVWRQVALHHHRKGDDTARGFIRRWNLALALAEGGHWGMDDDPSESIKQAANSILQKENA